MSALGLQSGQVPDSSMTASSVACSAQSARLHGNPLNGKQGAWCAAANNVDQWLQVDFGKDVKVQGVATQGRQNAAQWVTSYRLSYSYDGVFFKSYNDNEVIVCLPTLLGATFVCFISTQDARGQKYSMEPRTVKSVTESLKLFSSNILYQ